MRLVLKKKTKFSKKLISCNMCGELVELSEFNDNICLIEKTWGYGSKYDSEKHKIAMCADCYDEFIHSLEIPVVDSNL